MRRAPRPSALYDVLDLILDKGLVVDVYVRVSLVGIELLTIDARLVVASVDTYLRFAEAVNRLDLTDTGGRDLLSLPEDLKEGATRGATRGAVDEVKDTAKEIFSRGRKKDGEEERS